MNANSLAVINDHCFWQQRVTRELGNLKRYEQKAYQGAFDDNHCTFNKPFSSSSKIYLKSSYPIPYFRGNADHFTRQTRPGYMNDSSGLNPSDPSSMQNNGGLNNGVFNYHAVLPKAEFVSSNVPKKTNHDLMNMTFYNFGGRTNIQNSLRAKTTNRRQKDDQMSTITKASDMSTVRKMGGCLVN